MMLKSVAIASRASVHVGVTLAVYGRDENIDVLEEPNHRATELLPLDDALAQRRPGSPRPASSMPRIQGPYCSAWDG